MTGHAKFSEVEMREEITFLRDTFGYDDRDIARRLGVEWSSYLYYRNRHPELGPINDPVMRDQRERSEMVRGWGART